MPNDIPTYLTIVVKLLTEIDLLLQNYIYNGYSALSGALRIPLGLIASIYLAIFGYSIAVGWVRASYASFMTLILKIALVYTGVLNWDFVSEYLVTLVNDVINTVGAALLAASPIHIPGIDGINGALQLILIQFTKLGSVIFDSGGITNLGGWLDGLIIWGFGYLLVGLGLFEIVLSKVMLAILFIFTPLMVIFTFFKLFHSIFDRWLGAIVGFALLQLFVTAALTLGLSLAYWWIASFAASSALDIGNFGTLPVIVVGVICIGLIWKAAELAQNLGGLVTSASASAMVAGMVGGAMGSSFSLVSALNPFSLASRLFSSGGNRNPSNSSSSSSKKSDSPKPKVNRS